MTIEKRKRGRPVGSCIDDSPSLRQVADILLSDSKMKPTTAIRRVLASTDPSPIRRLQSKWEHDGAAYAKDARIRANRRAVDQTERIAAELERIAMQTANTGFNPNVGAILLAQRQLHSIIGEAKHINATAQAIQNAYRPLAGDIAQQIEMLRSQKLLVDSFKENGTLDAIRQAREAFADVSRNVSGFSKLGRWRGTV